MFWGVTLESGKRYSQTVTESYHLSMACLEALEGGTYPVNKEVSVMIEHGQSDYVLCVLEYGRVMQANLDIIFDCGEVVTYYLNGEGIVHLTGYALAETEDDKEAPEKYNDVSASNVHEDEEEEEADEDWTPSKEKSFDTSDESEESEDEESGTDAETEKVHPKKQKEIDQNQLSETNEDEETDDVQENQKMNVKGNKTKKRKFSDSSPAENGIMSDKGKTAKQQKTEVNHVKTESFDDRYASVESGSEDYSDVGSTDERSDDYSSEEEQGVSSAGRTPIPKKAVTSKTSLGESPDLPLRQKNSAKKQQKMKLKKPVDPSPNKGSVPVTPKNARKLNGNVQVEDLRTGSGPEAKRGRFVFLHYVGKLSNGKVFESCDAPKKPFSFRLGKGEVIKGLDIGLEGLKVGGKRRITIPPNMGYGNQKIDLIPPNSTLIFTVELKSVR